MSRSTSHDVRKVRLAWLMMSKEDAVLFVSMVFLILFLFSHLPATLSLPQGRLIKTNAIVGYHCNAGARRTAGSYFSFSLVWWCDFVFFRNRFVSNGSVYLSSLSPFPYSLCASVRMECFGLHCHITSSLHSSELHYTWETSLHMHGGCFLEKCVVFTRLYNLKNCCKHC